MANRQIFKEGNLISLGKQDIRNEGGYKVGYNNCTVVKTTDATSKTAITLTLAAGDTKAVKFTVVAREDDANTSAFYEGMYVFERDNATTVALISGSGVSHTAEDVGAWGMTQATTNPDTAEVKVTGAASSNITWHVYYTVLELNAGAF